MLTISDLIAVLALCATFYSLGYMFGKHDSGIAPAYYLFTSLTIEYSFSIVPSLSLTAFGFIPVILKPIFS